MKRPIGLAIAFTTALSLMTHEADTTLQAQSTLNAIGPQPQQKLEGPYRIASLVPGVERLLKPSAGN